MKNVCENKLDEIKHSMVVQLHSCNLLAILNYWQQNETKNLNWVLGWIHRVLVFYIIADTIKKESNFRDKINFNFTVAVIVARCL